MTKREEREEDYRADWDAGESKKEKAEEKASTKEGQQAAEREVEGWLEATVATLRKRAEEMVATPLAGSEAAEWRRAVAAELMTIAVELEAAELPPVVK